MILFALARLVDSMRARRARQLRQQWRTRRRK